MEAGLDIDGMRPMIGISGEQYPGKEDAFIHSKPFIHESNRPLLLLPDASDLQTDGKLLDESQVVNPGYYEIPGIEWDHPVTGRKTLTVWDIVHAMNLNHQQGNILKYVIRAGRKPGQSRAKDTRKVFWCAVSELRRLGESPPNEED